MTSTTDLRTLTIQERDRMTWEILEKKISEKKKERRKVMVLREQIEQLATETDSVVRELLNKLTRGYTFSDLNLATSNSLPLSPLRNNSDCTTKQDSLLYGCKDVYAELNTEMSRLCKAVTALSLMEGNPLSATRGFRHEATRLKHEIQQFVQKTDTWGQVRDSLYHKKIQ